ncbi:MAG: CPBP family intramembrane metalloprotease [Treponema sp.]|jgi:membrane protease YdiL (CAAX protease family)|nr:CPBP family intramembrane metalloprotease [Treponema sp.]
MGMYIETLTLFILLFLTAGGAANLKPGGYGGLLISSEFARIFLYNTPAAALILRLLQKEKSLKEWGLGKPIKKDLFILFLALPCLLLIGFAAVSASLFFTGGTSVKNNLLSPDSALLWIVLGFSCISTGYLEEIFFRFYLLSKRKELNMSDPLALIFSTALFSVCHIYEGPWGFINSIISGFLLSFIFLRYKSLHGIALAHGIYNFLAYVISAFSGH